MGGEGGLPLQGPGACGGPLGPGALGSWRSPLGTRSEEGQGCGGGEALDEGGKRG